MPIRHTSTYGFAWQTKDCIDKTCQGKLVDRRHEKVKFSRKFLKETLIVFTGLKAAFNSSQQTKARHMHDGTNLVRFFTTCTIISSNISCTNLFSLFPKYIGTELFLKYSKHPPKIYWSTTH